MPDIPPVLATTIVSERVDSLREHPQNPRQGDLGAVIEAITTNGYIVPVVAQTSTRIVIDGNHRLKAARSLGMVEIPVVWVDVDDETSLRHLLAANRTNDLASWDETALAAILTDLAQQTTAGLAGTGYDGVALDALLADLAALDFALQPKGADEGPTEPPVVPVTQAGDLWVLGEHRLLCGDATIDDAYGTVLDGHQADLTFTDPPYGVGYTGGAKPREALAGDHLGTSIYGDALPHLRIRAADHAALYLWYADAHAAAAAAAAAAAGYDVVAQIIWVKNNAQFVSSAKYHGKHEIAFYAHRKGKTAAWYGPNNEVTVWEVDRAARNDFHPTQKPVELAQRAINNSSASGNLVLDPFGGGGSTLIACEQTGRKARLIEIDPGYCDVICRRYQSLTGQLPTRDGVEHDFLSEDTTARRGFLRRGAR